MNIGMVAKQTGLSAKMIRYYEQMGFIQTTRRANGYREYSKAHIETLKFIQHARALGFDFAQIQTLLALWQDPKRSSRQVKTLTLAHIAALDQKIQSLQHMRAKLAQSLQQCPGDDTPSCSILSQIQWGNPNIQGEIVMKFRIDNMTCGGCARSVTATIQDVDPQAQVTIDVATKIVEVNSQLDVAKIVAALTEDGFPPVAI